MRPLRWSLALALALLPRPSPADPPIRLIALGDSFTIGTGSRPDQSFPARLAARWNAQGCPVTLRNLGVNGYTTQDLLDAEMPVVGSPPDLVTLAIGANDLVRGSTPETYRAQVHRIFAALASAHIPAAHVVVIPQPNWSRTRAAEDFGDRDVIHHQIMTFNAILRDEATMAGARYIDLWPLMLSQSMQQMVADDELHPSSAAYDGWADALAHTLMLPCAAPVVRVTLPLLPPSTPAATGR